MNALLCTAMGLAIAVSCAPMAGADPSTGHYAVVTIKSPSMTCVVASDDAEPSVGPNVVCQGDGFPGSPIDPASARHLHQAVYTASGNLSYRDANIPEGGDDFDPPELLGGNLYHFQGWSIAPTAGAVTFTNDATGHGMVVDGTRAVTPF